MSAHHNDEAGGLKGRFRLQFQRGLREYLARNASAAEGFGVIWERTLSQVPLEQAAQAEIYWELIQWARSYDLFTSAGRHAFLSRWTEA